MLPSPSPIQCQVLCCLSSNTLICVIFIPSPSPFPTPTPKPHTQADYCRISLLFLCLYPLLCISSVLLKLSLLATSLPKKHVVAFPVFTKQSRVSKALLSFLLIPIHKHYTSNKLKSFDDMSFCTSLLLLTQFSSPELSSQTPVSTCPNCTHPLGLKLPTHPLTNSVDFFSLNHVILSICLKPLDC